MRNKLAKRLKKYKRYSEPNYTQKDKHGGLVTTKIFDSREIGYERVNRMWKAADKPKYAY